MTDIASHAWQGMLAYGWAILLASTVCIALEMIAWTSRCSWQSRVRGAFFWVIYISITATSLAIFGTFWSQLKLTPLVTVNAGFLGHTPYPALHVLNWVIAPILAGVVGEFFYYWFHRAQHTFPIMWRFHAVHHSLREMNGVNNNHHFTEEIFRIPFITLPMSLLIGVQAGPVPAIILTIMGMQGQFEHSCTRFHLGWFRYVIADNRYHRIHHTIHPEDWGHNFGSLVSIWDVVFRTAKFPKKGEWPDVGIPGVDEPKTVKDFLFMPFRRGSLTGYDQPLAPAAKEAMDKALPTSNANA